jgi:hypothetical protein
MSVKAHGEWAPWTALCKLQSLKRFSGTCFICVTNSKKEVVRQYRTGSKKNSLENLPGDLLALSVDFGPHDAGLI